MNFNNGQVGELSRVRDDVVADNPVLRLLHSGAAQTVANDSSFPDHEVCMKSHDRCLCACVICTNRFPLLLA